MTIEEAIKQPVFRDPFQRAVINVSFTANQLQLELSRHFRTFDLTLPQFNILRILRGQHPAPASVSLLMDRMLDKTSNASRIVDRLETKQLIRRCQCPQDRRQVDVTITEAGLELLRRIDDAQTLHLVGRGTLTADEATTLSVLLDKMRG